MLFKALEPFKQFEKEAEFLLNKLTRNFLKVKLVEEGKGKTAKK